MKVRSMVRFSQNPAGTLGILTEVFKYQSGLVRCRVNGLLDLRESLQRIYGLLGLIPFPLLRNGAWCWYARFRLVVDRLGSRHWAEGTLSVQWQSRVLGTKSWLTSSVLSLDVESILSVGHTKLSGMIFRRFGDSLAK